MRVTLRSLPPEWDDCNLCTVHPFSISGDTNYAQDEAALTEKLIELYHLLSGAWIAIECVLNKLLSH